MTNIRTADVSDLATLTELFNGYRQFYKHASDMEACRRFLEQRFELKDSILYVADDTAEGTLTGFVQLYPLWSSTRLKRLWLLNDLFVRPDYRGKGISKLLMDRCKLLARETGACGLQLETDKDNLIGNSLYRQEGFELMNGNFYFFKTV